MGEDAREECGVTGVYLKKELSHYPVGGAAHYNFVMLNALQHRGQLSAGSITYSPQRRGLSLHKDIGLVVEVFKNSHEGEHRMLLEDHAGTIAIGHVRYPTSGRRDQPRVVQRVEAQPMLKEHHHKYKEFGIAINGNEPRYQELKEELERNGEYQLKTGVDTELVQCFIEKALNEESEGGKTKPLLEKVIQSATRNLDGSYSAVMLNGVGEFAAFRDPLGFKPLCYGENEDLIAFASESIALVKVGIRQENIRDVKPGHMVHLEDGILTEKQFAESHRRAHCMFEWPYFANAASVIDGVPVYDARRRLGIQLAKIEPLIDKLDDSYAIAAIPNTSVPIAQAMAHELGIEYITIMEKVGGRAFIDPSSKRKRTIMEKYNFYPNSAKGRKLLIVDDSFVRADTIKRIVTKVFEICKPDELHIRSACPPLLRPCYYGVDFPTLIELIANKYPPEKLEEMLAIEVGVNSAKYQKIEGLIEGIGKPKEELCLACLNGDYPTPGGRRCYEKLLVKQ
jgi:amidophosphoribosyltransferase